MAITNNLQPEMPEVTEEDACPTSALELQLAASIINAVVKRNGGSEIPNVFWDDDAFDSLEEGTNTSTRSSGIRTKKFCRKRRKSSGISTNAID